MLAYYATELIIFFKSFAILTSVENVIKVFLCNYIAITVTSVKIIGKYAASGVNYA